MTDNHRINNMRANTNEANGVVQDLRESPIDIAVVEGEGNDVFLKAGGDVLLVDEMEAQTLAKEIGEKLSADEKTPEEEWQDHNETFNYEPPQKPVEAWPSEAYTELWDRTIRRNKKWVCQKCNKPLGTLRKARRHVEKQHSDRLIEQAKAKIDDTDDENDEPETDGGTNLDEDQLTLTENSTEVDE